MRCTGIYKKLSAYVDDELPGTEKEALATHLSACSRCRDELAVLLKEQEYLRSLSVIKPSARFRAGFWRKAKAYGEKEIHKTSAWERTIFRWIPVPITCAGLIVLFSAFSVFSPLLYGGTNSDTKRSAVALAVDTFTGYCNRNVFAPLNFTDFCDRCHHLLCETCRQGACADCTECPMGKEEQI